MKYLILLFALLVCAPEATAQELPGSFERDEEISIFEVDSLFFLEVQKSGDQINGRDTLELGDVNDAYQYVLDLQTRMANKHVRLVRELYAQDYGRLFDEYDDLSDQLGFEQADSLRDVRFFNRSLVDTAALRIPISVIPDDEILDFTTDLTPPTVLKLEVRFFFKPSGVLRVENIATGKSWKVEMLNRSNFRINGFLGGKTDFIVMREVVRTNSTRSVWRRSSESTGAARAVRFTVVQTNN